VISRCRLFASPQKRGKRGRRLARGLRDAAGAPAAAFGLVSAPCRNGSGRTLHKCIKHSHFRRLARFGQSGQPLDSFLTGI